MKQAAYQALGKPLLESGFAVITINHRSSADAAYPAQINDVKAAIRFVRANADKYNIDPSFIGITGFLPVDILHLWRNIKLCQRIYSW